MRAINRSIEIKAPVQRVFDFLTQPSNLPGIWPNLVSVSNVTREPSGAHEFDWIYKMAGVHLKGHAKTSEIQPAKLVTVTNEGGIPSTFRWVYEGLNGSNTRLSVGVEYTVPAPVVGKLAEVVVAKLNEREMDMLLANLKDVMESSFAGVPAGARA